MTPDRKSQLDGEERNVAIEVGAVTVEGYLVLPSAAKGIVLFAHGSGSSRHSPRNQYVAEVLQSAGIATLLFDLLTRKEEVIDQYTGKIRFDIPFLAKRLVGVTRWIMGVPGAKDLKLGYFGASTGAGAALVAAAELPETISVIVSRGGRPDLAGAALGGVRAPTLLVVGEKDEPVITMNQEALARLGCDEKKLVIIPGATHLFEEPGTLKEVAKIAADWFAQHFTSVKVPAQGAAA
jgi:predicted alpha/beta-hydrolase family hydrolase